MNKITRTMKSAALFCAALLGLNAFAEATINDTSYATLASAIEAAEDGDTITLSSAVTEETITVGKDLTIDFNGKAAVLGGIVISEGKTLTVTRANSSSNVIPTITGGGNLVVTGNNTFSWTGMTGTSTIGSITQESTSGGVKIAGAGTVNVTGDVNVAATLTLTPDAATTTEITNGWTIKLTANSVTAGTLAGGGRIETTDGVVAKTSGFYGSFAGDGDVLFNADSTITAPSYFGSGKLSIADGKTLALSPYDYSNDIKFGFDASNPVNWLFEEDSTESVTSFVYTVGSTNKGNRFNSWGTTTLTYKESDEAYFGGNQPFVLFAEGCDYSVANTKSNPGYYNSLAWLFVYQKNDTTNTQLMDEKNGNGYFKVDSGAWSFRRHNSMLNDYLMVNGVKSTVFTAGEASTVAMLTRPTENNNRFDALVSDNTIAVAEAIGFKAVPSVEEYLAINAALQHKWNLADKTASQFIPTTASVELGSGSTLDLGGYTQMVASFSGGGTVQNGTLITDDNVYTDTGALSIQAVDNMTVVLDEGATALTITGDAADIKVTATEAFLASGSTITITATGLTGDNTIDFSEIPNNIFRFGVTDNEDGTWTVGAATGDYTAATYTWSPVNNSTDWTSLANWSVEGYDSVSVLPQSVDTVSVNTAGDITLSSDIDIYGLTIADEIRVCFKADVAKWIAVHAYTCGDDTTLALSNIYIRPQTVSSSGSAYTLRLGGTIEMVEGTLNAIYGNSQRISSNNKPAFYVEVTGNITGTGDVRFGNYNGTTRAYVMLSGDNSGFSGTATINGGNNGTLAWKEATAGSAAAKWQTDNNPTLQFGFTTGTICFGSLEYNTGNLQLAANSSPTVQIGDDGDETTCGIDFKRGSSSKSANLVKTGSSTLVFTGRIANGNGNGNITIEEGILDIAAEQSLPISIITLAGGTLAVSGTTTIVDQEAVTDPETGDEITPAVTHEELLDVSSYIRCANDASVKFKNNSGETHVWSTALDSSNTALVKKGAGTLTLSAAPAYTGDFEISVEAGKVVVPNTATNTKPGIGTKRTEVGSNFEYVKYDKVEDDDIKTTDIIVVPDFANQDAANAFAATYNVTLTDAQVTQGLETSYYKVVATQVGETTTYNMSVVLDEAEVGVDLGEEATATVSDSAVKITVTNLKSGLCYRIISGSSADGMTTEGDWSDYYDGSNAPSLSAALPTSGVMFYSVEASDTK